MSLLLLSFFAGVLTIMAPCVLPLLPVVIGAGVSARDRFTSLRVIGALMASIVVFTLVLKASTVFITVSPAVWSYVSGGLIAVVGLTLVWPAWWASMPGVKKLNRSSNQWLGAGYTKKSALGEYVMGVSLGPVFSSCSPTYFLILATVLPVSFGTGLVYLGAYVLGLGLVLLLIARLGERFAVPLARFMGSTRRLQQAAGMLLMLVALLIITGGDKWLETAILDAGWIDSTRLEYQIGSWFGITS